MNINDRTIYELCGDKMIRLRDPADPAAKFMICCGYSDDALGIRDWSGLQTLAECEAQFAELEGGGRMDGCFRVVERIDPSWPQFQGR